MQVASEQDVKNVIIEYCRARGMYIEKFPSGKIMKSYNGKNFMVELAREGNPDLIVCCAGKFLGIEVKKSREEYEKWERQWEKHLDTGQRLKAWERSIAQHERHIEIRKAGGEVATVFSLEELEKDLLTLGFIS